MKKLILTAIFALGTLAAFAQGGILFANHISSATDWHPVYAPQTDFSDTDINAWGVATYGTAMITGQSSLGAPSGTTVYEGALLQSGYDFALFAGPVGTGSNNLQLVTTVAFRSSTSNGFPAGAIVSTQVSVSTVPGGQFADYQLRAWNTESGTINSWAAALAAWQAGDTLMQIGWTPVLTTSSVLSSGVLVPPNTDFTSFSLVSQVNLPEPGTLALIGLGAGGLLAFRRRK